MAYYSNYFNNLTANRRCVDCRLSARIGGFSRGGPASAPHSVMRVQPQVEQPQMSTNEMEPGGKGFCRRRGLNYALSQDRTRPSNPARVRTRTCLDCRDRQRQSYEDEMKSIAKPIRS